MPSKRAKNTAASLRKILAVPFAVFMTGMLSIAAFSFVFIFKLGHLGH